MLVRTQKDIDRPAAHIARAADLSRLDIQAVSLPPAEVRQALVESELGDLTESGEHAWLRVEALRTAREQASTSGGGLPDEQWENNWCAMLRYAGSRGWVSQDGRLVRAHVNYATTGPQFEDANRPTRLAMSDVSWLQC